ncbi:MAG: PmoA family protein [Candidatus Hodarchaeota archaeon]
MELVIVVLAGQHERFNTPVSKILKKDIGKEGIIWFKDEENNAWYPADVWKNDDGKSEICLLIPYMHEFQELELELDEDGPPNKDDLLKKLPVSLTKKSEEEIEIKVKGEKLTALHFNDAERPYLYPLMGPQGQGMTRNFPCKKVKGETNDHPHHRSVWTAYGEVAEVDHWSVSGMHGFIKTKEFPKFSSGVAAGRIVMLTEWKNKFGDEDEMIDERREIRIYNLPRGMQQIDFDIKLMANKGDVLFGDTKEGGFLSIRVATSMDGNKGGFIENSFGGKNESECWGKRAPWVDYSGPVNGFKVGMAILEHPESFMYPTYWHVRDYGLFSANPFGLKYFTNKRLNGDYTLKNGDSMTFKYRLLIHAGDARDGKVAERYLNYIFPPDIKEIDF